MSWTSAIETFTLSAAESKIEKPALDDTPLDLFSPIKCHGGENTEDKNRQFFV